MKQVEGMHHILDQSFVLATPLFACFKYKHIIILSTKSGIILYYFILYYIILYYIIFKQYISRILLLFLTADKNKLQNNHTFTDQQFELVEFSLIISNSRLWLSITVCSSTPGSGRSLCVIPSYTKLYLVIFWWKGLILFSSCILPASPNNSNWCNDFHLFLGWLLKLPRE